MKETGILMTPDNHRAIRDKRKWQTRRMIVPQPYYSPSNPPHFSDTKVGDFFICPDLLPTKEQRGYVIEECTSIGCYHAMGVQQFVERHCPYGVPGDRLYVKEATWMWCDAVPNGTTKTGKPKIKYVPVGQNVVYCLDHPKPTARLDHNPRHCWRLKTAMFMSKRYARTWCEITDVRVQRLQDISEEDAKDEGSEYLLECGCDDSFHERDDFPRSYRLGYQKLWDSINRSKHPWSSNPFVWAITYKLLAGREG